MMNEKDAERLIKFIEMMSSDHDGEALNALRMAQKLMKRYNMRLSDFVRFAYQHAQTSQAPIQQPAPRPAPPSNFASGLGGLGGQYDPFWQQRQQAMNNAFSQAHFYQNMQGQYQADVFDRDNRKRGFFKK